jgi:hypothetical protein
MVSGSAKQESPINRDTSGVDEMAYDLHCDFFSACKIKGNPIEILRTIMQKYG